jgi:ribosomal protein L37AE/L43A
MALARHKWQRANRASTPLACEVCREEPVTTLVADFIFTCDSCAKRIATALWQGRQGRVVVGENFFSDREMNRWVH